MYRPSFYALGLCPQSNSSSILTRRTKATQTTPSPCNELNLYHEVLSSLITHSHLLSDNPIHPLRNHITSDTKRNQTRGNRKEPLEVSLILVQSSAKAQVPTRVSKRHTSCPGTHTFIPHIPVIIFIGKTIVPSTVNFPRISAFCSARSFMRMLIWAT